MFSLLPDNVYSLALLKSLYQEKPLIQPKTVIGIENAPSLRVLSIGEVPTKYGYKRNKQLRMQKFRKPNIRFDERRFVKFTEDDKHYDIRMKKHLFSNDEEPTEVELPPYFLTFGEMKKKRDSQLSFEERNIMSGISGYEYLKEEEKSKFTSTFGDNPKNIDLSEYYKWKSEQEERLAEENFSMFRKPKKDSFEYSTDLVDY